MSDKLLAREKSKPTVMWGRKTIGSINNRQPVAFVNEETRNKHLCG